MSPGPGEGALTGVPGAGPGGYRHEALLFTGETEFLAKAGAWVAGALAAGQPVAVGVDPRKTDALRSRLGPSQAAVRWIDIRTLGRNPARIIPIWRQFVEDHGDAERVWGIGEPVWAERDADSLQEAQRHERLLNRAFGDRAPFSLLCPYDRGALSPAVVEQAAKAHPIVLEAGGAALLSPHGEEEEADAPLPEPPSEARRVAAPAPLAELRSAVRRAGRRAGLDSDRTDHLLIALHALLGAGVAAGRVAAWADAGRAFLDITGLPGVGDPLAGREWPAPKGGIERGLWIANQLCDLVQLRSEGGTTRVRLRVEA